MDCNDERTSGCASNDNSQIVVYQTSKDQEDKVRKRKHPLKQKRRSENEEGRTFRCSLIPMLTLESELHDLIRSEHLQVLAKTPFGMFFNTFYNKRLTKKDVKKSTHNIISIMSTYSLDEDAFNIGGKLVKLTVDDVALTFGLPKQGKKVTLQPKNVNMESDFMHRKFAGVEKLNKAAIVTAIKKTILMRGETEVKDFARLVILYMAVTIFFPNAIGSIGWSFVQHIEDFNKMNEISWPTAVHEHLMTQVRKYHKKPIKAAGCVIQLLYWFCEHVDIISPINGFGSALPRVARWSFSDLSQAMQKQSLKNLQEGKVTTELKFLSPEEKELLEAEMSVTEIRKRQEANEIETLWRENEKLKDENLELKEKVEKLETNETETLRRENEKLKGANVELKEKVEKLETTLAQLKRGEEGNRIMDVEKSEPLESREEVMEEENKMMKEVNAQQYLSFPMETENRDVLG